MHLCHIYLDKNVLCVSVCEIQNILYSRPSIIVCLTLIKIKLKETKTVESRFWIGMDPCFYIL